MHRVHDEQLYDHLRTTRRKRSDRWLLYFMFVLAVIGFFVVPRGRGLLFARRAQQFIGTADEKSPAEVKAELQRYVDSLSDINPMVRESSVAVLKAITGENVGTGSWITWWETNRATWEYVPRSRRAKPSGGSTPP
jgi:hypothetical protein